MDPSIGRKMWERIESPHAYIYFVPEASAEYTAIGVERIAHYFASRAAAMGAVNGATVAATYYNFSPGLCARAMRDVWSQTTPGEMVAARYRAVGTAGQRLWGDHLDLVSAALELAKIACEALEPAGRPLFAGHASVAPPDQPISELWHYLTLIREYRGDGHVLALVAHDLSPIGALQTAGAHTGASIDFLRKSRGWSDEEWRSEHASLVEAGLLSSDGSLTKDGGDLRTSIEDLTNSLAMAPWVHLGESQTMQLAELLQPLGQAVRKEPGLAG